MAQEIVKAYVSVINNMVVISVNNNPVKSGIIYEFELPENYQGGVLDVIMEDGKFKALHSKPKEQKTVEKHQSSSKSQQQGKDNGGWQGGGNKGYQGGKQKQPSNQGGKQQREPARAPYNFVPLNEKVISGQESVNNDSFHSDRLSGHIDIELTTLTTFFIRQEKDQTDFFRVEKGNPIVPGSSLRGLIRNLVEICTYSELDIFEDKQLYRRFNMLYDKDEEIRYGFIIKRGENYIITETSTKPSQEQKYRSDLAGKEYQYEFNETSNTCLYSIGEFQNFCRVWKFELNSKGDLPQIQENVIIGYRKDISRDDNAIDILMSLDKGYIVDSSKNHKQIGSSRVNIPDKLGIPVFFRVKNKQVVSFGNAKYHRLPYIYSIANFVKQNIEAECINDFPKTIFGTTTQSTKVFFEDGSLKAGQQNILLSSTPLLPKILASPKPTTYQHYLTQENIHVTDSHQNKWDDKDAFISGFKGYWHRAVSNDPNQSYSWVDNGKKTGSHSEKILPLREGVYFNTRLRFENLTAEELGALLFALDLPKGCAHKLGMGKPLGLGSVNINVEKLTLIDRKARYENVFGETGNWNTGESVGKVEVFKNAFAKYICNAISAPYTEADGENNLWKINRMKELKTMLTLKHNLSGASVNLLERTRYQVLDEFKKRPVLPTPSEVIEKNFYKK